MMVIKTIFGILLFILKITGILIAIVLGLLLLILLSILFVAIKYKAEGCFDSKSMDGNAKISISWFFKAISVHMWFEEKKAHYYVRIFGLKLINSDKKKADEETSADEVHEELQEFGQPESITENEKTKEENIENEKNPDEKTKEEFMDEKTVENTKAEETVKEDTKESVQTQKKVKRKKKHTKKIQSIMDKLKALNDKKNEYVEFLTTPESKQAVRYVKEILFKVLRHVSPKKVRGEISYGLEDPETTAKIYGILCVFFIRGMDKVVIDAHMSDVDKAFVNGKLKLGGRIRIVVFLIAAVKIYRNRRIKEFISFMRG